MNTLRSARLPFATHSVALAALLALAACGGSDTSTEAPAAAKPEASAQVPEGPLKANEPDAAASESPAMESNDATSDNAPSAESTDTPANKSEVVLRRSNGAEPGSLDPHLAEGVTASNVLRDLYEGLVSEAPNGDLVGGVATSWTVSDDGLRYEFTLRPDAKWSNGDPVTSADFVYSLRRAVDPKTRSTYADILAPIKNASAIIKGDLPTNELGVMAQGPLKLTIELGGVTPYFLGLLTHSMAYPVHRATVEQFAERFVRAENSVTNGPYKLVEWKIRSHVKAVRNPAYWNNAKSQIDSVYFLAIEDQSSALKRYQAGEIDWLESLPSTEVDRVRKKRPNEFKTFNTLAVYYYEFNTKKPPLDNAKVRQALSLAINRKIIIDRIGKLDQDPAYGWVPFGTANTEHFTPEHAGWTQAQRNAKAKALLAEAGYANKPLEIEILYNTSEGHKKIALAISAMWKQTLGVKTTLRNQEWKVFLKSRDAGDFEAARAGWVGDYNDPYTFAEIMIGNHGQNNTGYASAEYDRLTSEAAITPDLAQRAELLKQAEAVLVADAPVAPIYFYKSARVIKPWVKGFVPNVLGHFPTKHLSIER